MKILMVNPLGSLVRPPNFFPLGMGYIAAVLRKKHEIIVLDIDALRLKEDEAIERLKDLLKKADVVLTGGLSSSYKYLKWLNREIKHIKNIKIIVGNNLATHSPELVLKNLFCDYVVIGEGEITIQELLGNLNSPEKVNGIGYMKNSRAIINPPRKRIENLDKIPFPAWDLFPMDIYLKHALGGSSERGMNMISNRGCPYNCNYCSKLFGRNVAVRSPENVIAEIKELKKRYGVKYIKMIDEITLPSFIEKFCDLMNKENLGVKWRIVLRAGMITDNLIKKMRGAGCIYLYFGAESMCQKILDNMNKHQTVEQIVNAVRILRKNRMNFSASFMIGYPGEDEDSIKETVMLRIKHNLPGHFNFTTPYPGTALYEYAIKKGLVKNEEEYLEKLSSAALGSRREKPLVNLTEMSDDKLMTLNKWACKKINSNPKIFLGRTVRYIKSMGLRGINGRLFRDILSEIR